MTSFQFSKLWPIWSNPEAGFRRPVKNTFLLTVTFNLTKTENRTKKSPTLLRIKVPVLQIKCLHQQNYEGLGTETCIF